jgi:hypothetical protein
MGIEAGSSSGQSLRILMVEGDCPAACIPQQKVLATSLCWFVFRFARDGRPMEKSSLLSARSEANGGFIANLAGGLQETGLSMRHG